MIEAGTTAGGGALGFPRGLLSFIGFFLAGRKFVVWVNKDKKRVTEAHTFSRSVVIFIRVSRLVLSIPVVHPIVVVTTDTVIHDKIVFGKTALDDPLVLFLRYLIVEARVFLLDPRSTATLACTLELGELIELCLLFAFGAISHSYWSSLRLGERPDSVSEGDVDENATCHASVTLRGSDGSLLYACHLIKNDVPKVADGYLQTILVVLLIAAKTKHASLEYLFRSGS